MSSRTLPSLLPLPALSIYIYNSTLVLSWHRVIVNSKDGKERECVCTVEVIL